MAENVPNRRQQASWAAIAVCVGIVVVFGLVDRFGGSEHDVRRTLKSAPAAESSHPNAAEQPKSVAQRDSKDTKGTSKEQDDPLVIRNVRVLDEDRHVVYEGDVDLRPTLARIEKGQRLRFSHDGIVFENRERRLPRKPPGYYHEFVQPTPGEDGPGAQRVVMGEDGEVYYTYDHYRTFRKVR